MDKKKKPQINSTHNHPGSRRDPALEKLLQLLTDKHIRYLDLIPRASLEEKIVHLVLEGYGPWSEMGPVFDQLLEAIKQYHTNELRTVVFGGGSGLSGILGGDTALSTWHQSPFDGLKRMFSRLTVAVCVTDDGGSSGKLLRDLGCIAVGDLRRAILSSITPRGLLNRYSSLNLEQLESVADALQHILNYRFSRTPNRRFLKAPSTVISQKLRRSVPDSLLEYLDKTGAAFLEDPLLKDIRLEEQCLGNLLLISSIYSQRKGREQKDTTRRFTPTHLQIMKGIQDFAFRIGAGPDTIFPAYTTQGELQVLYQHGVLSAGEAKSARKHSSFPVDRVWVHFVRKPQVSSDLLKKIEEADLIICAPGSLYTSIIPIFQVPAITEAVRNNRRAVKILGANFWAQRGETDISVRLRGKEFYVSDIIEAYNNNIAGGAAGLFETIIVTDLQSIPGDILRNYALEGKVPIYLDKQRVREMGIEPVEAAVFSEQKLRNEKVIQHDPVKFARVVKALYYLRRNIKKNLPAPSLPPSPFDHRTQFPRKGFLSDHWAAIHRRVQQLDSAHPKLRKVLLDILWDNREILLEHLSFIRGIKKVRRQHWTRSTEWDNILGYYETEGRCLMIHEDLLRGPEHRLREDMLIALGESLLGNYCLSKSVHEIWEEGAMKGKEFAIDLRPVKKRRIFLNDSELREYLSLAQLSPGVQNPDRFRMLINSNEAFTPPGLLFGLLYAWYVNNRFGGIINYEASLLRWKINELIPKPSMERVRMQKRIDFFRNVVFRQGTPLLSAPAS